MEIGSYLLEQEQQFFVVGCAACFVGLVFHTDHSRCMLLDRLERFLNVTSSHSGQKAESVQIGAMQAGQAWISVHP